MIPAPTARTRLLALLGDPVEHSLSPRFQNAAVAAAGVDAAFLALRCDADALPHLLVAIARAGGAGNVTIPHKETAARSVERRTPAVERTGACNCFWLEGGAVHGDNTDVHGVSEAVRELTGTDARGMRVLLLGAGGAALAAVHALASGGAREILLHNRTPARAEEVHRRFADLPVRIRPLPDLAALRGEAVDLVVNATSLGLRDGDPSPLDPDTDLGIGAALDLVYRPEETAWARAMRARGIRACDGLAMLLHQGAAAWERWWGTPAPLDAMRAALPSRPSHADTAVAPAAG